VTFIDHINAKIEYELIDLDQVNDAYALWLSAAWRFCTLLLTRSADR
jgi:hypothetical protein